MIIYILPAIIDLRHRRTITPSGLRGTDLASLFLSLVSLIVACMSLAGCLDWFVPGPEAVLFQRPSSAATDRRRRRLM